MDPSSFYSRRKQDISLEDNNPSSDEETQIMDSGSDYEPEQSSDSDDNISTDEDAIDEENEDEVQYSISNSQWQAVSSKPRGFTFTGKEELSLHAVPSKEGIVWPIDVYMQFINDDVFDLIIKQTNLYAAQVLASTTLT